MADRKVQYLVRANSANLLGNSTSFECLSGFSNTGELLFEQTRTVAPGRRVFVVTTEDLNDPLEGFVYLVQDGEPMVKTPLQATLGDTIRVTCPGSDILLQSGAIFTVTDDGSLAHSSIGLLASMALPAIGDHEGRIAALED